MITCEYHRHHNRPKNQRVRDVLGLHLIPPWVSETTIMVIRIIAIIIIANIIIMAIMY